MFQADDSINILSTVYANTRIPQNLALVYSNKLMTG